MIKTDSPRRPRLLVALALLTVVLSGLTTGSAQATFPGGNGLVLFNRGGNLFTATATGGSVKQLTTGGGITGAKWSPDGKSIAYKRGTALYVRTVASGAVRTVAAGVDSAPQWSPDGSRLAFVAALPGKDCGEQAVYTVSAATGGVATLAFDPMSDNCPHGTDVWGLGTYLPTGHLLLTGCYGWRDDSCTILNVTMDGSNAYQRILQIWCGEESEYPDHLCSFEEHLSDARTAAGGTGIVFSGRGGYEAPTGTLPGSTPTPTSTTPERLYTIDTAGTRLRLMTTAKAGYSPTLSPDGKTVLFTQTSGSTTNLMKSGTATTSVPSLFLANASQADWQPVR